MVDIYCTANVNMNPACLMQINGISANGPVYMRFGRALSKVQHDRVKCYISHPAKAMSQRGALHLVV